MVIFPICSITRGIMDDVFFHGSPETGDTGKSQARVAANVPWSSCHH